MDSFATIMVVGASIICGFTYLLHRLVLRKKWVLFIPSVVAAALAFWLIIVAKQSGGDPVGLGLVFLAVVLLLWAVCGVLFALLLVWFGRRKS